jgi:hypothetical protein
MADLILKALLNYIEKHPEIIENVVEALIDKLVADLKKKHEPV